MTLLAGKSLDAKIFFQSGQPLAHGSSFDLTIGHVYDQNGIEVEGPFTIKPGHMVQVVSSEIFCLSDHHTGHVTYKTALTKKGIWALTVGIVDAGWTGPIATTLLNFSRADHAIDRGDPFLRVSFFEHEPIAADKLRKAPPLDAYLKDIRKTAASMFPPTFLDTEDIAKAAGNKVLTRIRTEALVWVAGIALIFTVMQMAATSLTASSRPTEKDFEIESLRTRMQRLETRLQSFEALSRPSSGAAAPPGTQVAPSVPAGGSAKGSNKQ